MTDAVLKQLKEVFEKEKCEMDRNMELLKLEKMMML